MANPGMKNQGPLHSLEVFPSSLPELEPRPHRLLLQLDEASRSRPEREMCDASRLSLPGSGPALLLRSLVPQEGVRAAASSALEQAALNSSSESKPDSMAPSSRSRSAS